MKLKKTAIGICILVHLVTFDSIAQKLKPGINFTYDLYSNLNFIDGVQSSWKYLYTYNYNTYYYDIENHYWPYDQLNLDISTQLGNKFLCIEPFFSFTILKGWYGVTYDDGKYVADEAVLYLPTSNKNPVFVNGEKFLYAQGSGKMGQKRFGTNILFGDEMQIGIGLWWQNQKIELYKSKAYNKYWYSEIYSTTESDAYITYDNEIYILEPGVETVYKKSFLVPLIMRYKDGLFSTHITFVFQKPFQLLMGCGIYF